MPFGMANISRHFCAWFDLWFSSFIFHFKRANPFHAVLGSYVDDGFGGARTQTQAQLMIYWLYAVGHASGTAFNKKKTRGKATSLVIMGLIYCSVTLAWRVGDKKRAKYLSRICIMMHNSTTTSKELEQIVGHLGYAAWVEPFGRPLLTFLAHHIDPRSSHSPVTLSALLRTAFSI